MFNKTRILFGSCCLMAFASLSVSADIVVKNTVHFTSKLSFPIHIMPTGATDPVNSIDIVPNVPELITSTSYQFFFFVDNAGGYYRCDFKRKWRLGAGTYTLHLNGLQGKYKVLIKNAKRQAIAEATCK